MRNDPFPVMSQQLAFKFTGWKQMCLNFCKWEKAASEIISIFKVSKQRVSPCSSETASNQRKRLPCQPAVICIVLLCYLMCHGLLVTWRWDIFIIPPADTLHVPISPVQKSPHPNSSKGIERIEASLGAFFYSYHDVIFSGCISYTSCDLFSILPGK